MQLPPKLRSVIYDFALVSTDAVDVAPLLVVPPLLLTCRQIRREAMPTYTEKNYFRTHIRSCDVQITNNFFKHWRSLGGKNGLAIRIQLHGQLHWANLVAWGKTIWAEGDFTRLNQSLIHDAESRARADFLTVVGTVCELAGKTREDGKGWEEVTKALVMNRKLAGRIDARWLEDV